MNESHLDNDQHTNNEDVQNLNDLQEEVESTVQSTPKENDNYEDKYLRLYADFENFRKRTTKEKLEMSSIIKSEVSSKFIAILDDLERMLSNVPNEEKNSSIITPIEMIKSKFLSILHSMGIKEMEISVNEDKLNPLKHEALTTMNVENDSQKGKIVAVVEKGYILNNSIVRFAKYGSQTTRA